jgi:hypothetical protein
VVNTYTVPSSPTLPVVASGLVNLTNKNSSLQALGVVAVDSADVGLIWASQKYFYGDWYTDQDGNPVRLTHQAAKVSVGNSGCPKCSLSLDDGFHRADTIHLGSWTDAEFPEYANPEAAGISPKSVSPLRMANVNKESALNELK